MCQLALSALNLIHFPLLLLRSFYLLTDHTDANDPRKVIVKKLALCVPGRDDMELDLSGDISKLKKQMFTIKEGVQYKIRIDFLVQREIVHGLKYVQKTYRMCVPGEFFGFSEFVF